ncbi:MAG: hypothetical protein HZA90_04755 [Verrucomicrobia bacterium]|nr:hypothetical protein [Verrucomicrobiota bacterium]
MKHRFLALLFGVLATVWVRPGALAANPAPLADSPFATPLALGALDTNAFVAWVDGAEKPITVKEGPRLVLWTRNSTAEWQGVTFGESKNSGPRHLRLGWDSPVTVGSVLVRGGGQLSVLKATALYPGQLDHEADWLPAQRIKDDQLSRDEVTKEEYAIWILPPGTTTRALRFTHTSALIDKSYAGWLGSAFVLSERWVNVAAYATASASGNNDKASKLNNSSNDGTWSAWDNAPETNAPLVSAEHPVLLTLTWPQPVKLRGLNALWAGFRAADVLTSTGPADKHPRDASDADWQLLRSFDKIENQYPRALGVNWLDFDREVTTRAVRLRVTKVIDEARAHGHLKGNTKGGRRVWLGELLALQSLGAAELSTAIVAAPKKEEVHPPIPIRFTLPEEGFVTLVIEDPQGRRVRNLISETRFPAGENTAWWDGMDDLLRDNEAVRHGVYHIPAQFVQPGAYRVRGLWRKQVDLRYEFSIYNAGSPAWETADSTGAWLANHTPPCAALFVPADRAPGAKPLVFLGSYVSEGGHGLAWVDLDGRKQGGVGWVGGNWTGAPYLARDDGPQRDTNAFAYAAAAWGKDDAAKAKIKPGEIRITALTTGGNKLVVKYDFKPEQSTNSQHVEWSDYIGGLAARDGLLVVSMTKIDQLLFVDAKTKQAIGTAPLANPRGLAFDKEGKLLALSGNSLVRFKPGPDPIALAKPETVIAGGTLPLTQSLSPNGGEGARRAGEGEGGSRKPTPLESPRALTLDSSGNIFISDRGQSHQVKVFSPAGKFLRAIGKPGVPEAGPYDRLHMNNPDGLTIDSSNRLWVTENDFQPKRVSVWTLDGMFVRAFYGPSEYGGGGKLDPDDKTKFYFHGMEFRLDWDKGTDQVVSVFSRPSANGVEGAGPTASALPETPHSVRGRKYFSNDHNSNPTGGPGVTMLWLLVDGVARPVAALGRAHEWKLFKTDTFKPLWPQGVDLRGDYWRNVTAFAWSDLNGDGLVQTNEVQFQKGTFGSATVAPDLAMIVSRYGTNAMRFAPVSFTKPGGPVYDLARGEVLARDVQNPTSSGGDQALWHESGWTVLTTPPKPFAPQSVGAVFKGEPRWSYPSPWPGLHASHESPPPSFPGMVIGTTRLLGDFVTPHGSDAGPLWCVNGNQGNMYLFTADGLFVAELFKDVRRGPSWSMPVAQRGMLLNDLTLHDENFWPSITQTKDGKVYLVDGGRSSLVRVDGLETIRRLPETSLNLSADDLAKARAYFVEAEAARQMNQGSGTMKVALRANAPVIDGALDDWQRADWVEIDKSGVAAYFDSKSKPYDVRGAVAVSGDRLFAAWRTGDANLLKNTGEMPNALFKTGGALDLMIGVDAGADEKRGKPVVGDARLLVAQVKGKTVAALYRAVVPGTKEPVPFSSPWRTITLDRVDDVSADVQLAAKDGNFEISIPLAALGLKPAVGQRLKGDIGVLRGNGFQTLQRVYWANKASGITADVPSEAELTPRLWGRWEFK